MKGMIMPYVDGFVVPIAKKSVAAYTRMAKQASKVWMEHGALEYRECVGDDLKIKGVASFLTQMEAKPSETVIFAWIVYRSKAHRDQVNKKVMKDPRFAKMMEKGGCPFDVKRMLYGGFKTIVKA